MISIRQKEGGGGEQGIEDNPGSQVPEQVSGSMGDPDETAEQMYKKWYNWVQERKGKEYSKHGKQVQTVRVL